LFIAGNTAQLIFGRLFPAPPFLQLSKSILLKEAVMWRKFKAP
jgi:hypothetical protein